MPGAEERKKSRLLEFEKRNKHGGAGGKPDNSKKGKVMRTGMKQNPGRAGGEKKQRSSRGTTAKHDFVKIGKSVKLYCKAGAAQGGSGKKDGQPCSGETKRDFRC